MKVHFVTLQDHEGLHEYGFFTDREKAQAEVNRLEEDTAEWDDIEVYIDLHEGTIMLDKPEECIKQLLGALKFIMPWAAKAVSDHPHNKALGNRALSTGYAATKSGKALLNTMEGE